MTDGRPISVARDLPGIRTAALELFEEMLVDEECEKALARAQNKERVAASFAEKRSLADGYYVWTEYLLSLQATLNQGFSMPLADLRATEVLGLNAIRGARQEFERTHPSCGKCGVVNFRHATRCRNCDASFKENA